MTSQTTSNAYCKSNTEKRYNKVKVLQWLLTHSHAAKLLAVKKVCSNRGAKTAGVDGVIWRTSEEKLQAAKSLHRHGYRALPLRRVYIPKLSGKQRPLGIPTLRDRAMQALYLLALEPVAETQADPNSYGFRPKRSTQDAMQQCFLALASRYKAEWILECDIESCFDQISHDWLMKHVKIDRPVLHQWLKAGYLEKLHYFDTEEGTPQGGILSPILANITLDGLEKKIKAAAGKREKVNVIRYADDFIVTGVSPETLVRLKSVIESYLAERGLKLSEKKTKITSVYEGFNFLGFNIRKYNKVLITKPAKANLKRLRATLRSVVSCNVATPTKDLIKQLNPKLLGWGNYYRHVAASRMFATIDHVVFELLWAWAKSRHPKKSSTWIKRKYFRRRGFRDWVFSAGIIEQSGKKRPLDVIQMNTLSIKRYVKIRAQANLYDPAYKEYFKHREARKQSGTCTGYWRHNIAPHYV